MSHIFNIMKDKYTEHTALQVIGERIRMLRIRNGMEQQDVANHCGLVRSTIGRLENGGGVSLSNLLKILRALGEIDRIDDFLPEEPISPVLLAKNKGKEVRRVRRKKKDDDTGGWKW